MRASMNPGLASSRQAKPPPRRGAGVCRQRREGRRNDRCRRTSMVMAAILSSRPVRASDFYPHGGKALNCAPPPRRITAVGRARKGSERKETTSRRTRTWGRRTGA